MIIATKKRKKRISRTQPLSTDLARCPSSVYDNIAFLNRTRNYNCSKLRTALLRRLYHVQIIIIVYKNYYDNYFVFHMFSLTDKHSTSYTHERFVIYCEFNKQPPSPYEFAGVPVAIDEFFFFLHFNNFEYSTQTVFVGIGGVIPGGEGGIGEGVTSLLFDNFFVMFHYNFDTKKLSFRRRFIIFFRLTVSTVFSLSTGPGSDRSSIRDDPERPVKFSGPRNIIFSLCLLSTY